MKQRTCPACQARHRRNDSYCQPCRAAYLRMWRRRNPLTPEQRVKANCRTYANVYLERGKLTRKPCRSCGSADSQMHHPDYSQPLKVRWYCRPCHLQLHRRART